MFRIGYGEDIHKLEEGYPLIIGGVRIESGVGAVSHSDGDVLIHALCDALLGALALGDIGKWFPDTSEEWRGVASSLFLKKIMGMLKDQGYEVVNVDTLILLERPRIGGYIEAIRKNLSGILEVPIESISIKAGTYEGMGEVGKGKAIISRAVVLIYKKGAKAPYEEAKAI